MSELLITGGTALSGVHETPGNKNAALPMLCAALLTEEPVKITNLPLIRDVRVTLELIAALGADVAVNEAEKSVTIHASNIKTTTLPAELCSKVRASILFAGPLLARFGSAVVAPPGGDVIGKRRIDTHVLGLKKLGFEMTIAENGAYDWKAFPGGKRAKTYFLLDEASVTATENLIMAAVLVKGETELYNVACEPHVQDLCRMLASMGAQIEGIGTNRVKVRGVDSLRGTTARIGADYIDAGSYIAAALATGGSLTVKGIDNAADFAPIVPVFHRFNVNLKFNKSRGEIHVPRTRLEVMPDFGNSIPTVQDGTWPAFPSDLMSVMIVLAIRAKGTTLFFEKMFESRMYFVDHLIGMGARIVQCDPHRIVVNGASPLHAATVTSPDIRAGIALLIAGMIAEGTTKILNAQSIDRGYEAVDERLAELGAKIVRKA